MKGVLLRLLIASTLAVISFGCRPAERAEYVYDAEGRIVIYHGVAVSNTAKQAPDYLPWQTQADMAPLRTWGFNLVRYVVFWEGIEPIEGTYNDAYIAATVERIGWLRDLGIDVIVDFHQDLYARRFSGNGFPDWTVDDGGHEFTMRQPWNLNYLEPAVAASYDHFWNSETLKTQYIAAVERMMAAVDGMPNVIGVDVMNEPWPWASPLFEETCLTAFYEDLQAMMLRNDFKSRLCFEPVIFTSAALPTNLRFKPSIPSVYCPHYYDPLVHEGVAYADLNAWWMANGMAGKVAEAKRFGTPMIYGEFGISSEVEGWDRYLRDFLTLADAHQVGWVYWAYDREDRSSFGILEASGEPDIKLPVLTRVYPQRIAGRNPEWTIAERTITGQTPAKQTLAESTPAGQALAGQSFELQYDPIDTNAPTIIFVPTGLSGVRVTVNGAEVQWDAAQQYFTHLNAGATERQTIRIEWE